MRVSLQYRDVYKVKARPGSTPEDVPLPGDGYVCTGVDNGFATIQSHVQSVQFKSHEAANAYIVNSGGGKVEVSRSEVDSPVPFVAERVALVAPVGTPEQPVDVVNPLVKEEKKVQKETKLPEAVTAPAAEEEAEEEPKEKKSASVQASAGKSTDSAPKAKSSKDS